MKPQIVIAILLGLLCAPMLWGQTSMALDPLAPQVLKQLGIDSKALESLASTSYQEGDYLKAAGAYLEILKRNPDNSNALYNLACCYGLLGEEALASEALGMAYKAGFEDLRHIDGDPDFEPVRESAEYKAVRDSLDVWAARKSQREGREDYYPISTYLPYRIYLPEDYDASKAYSLIIGLHGVGDNALSFGYLYQALKDRDIIMVVPEAPFILPAKDFKGYSWSPMVSPDHSIWEPASLKLEAALMGLRDQIVSQYTPTNVWLMGFSQGCAYTLMLGLRNPAAFDGLLAFGGWLETDVLDDTTLKAAKEVPVYLVHGKQDRVLEFARSEDAFTRLQSLGYDVFLHSFEGGHVVDREALFKGISWLSAK